MICGKPHKWVYNLSRIIAKNFRVRFYYSTNKSTDLHFVGLSSDIQIAEITFQYAKGSIGYSSRQFMQKSEIKRKRKRKWQLKQDYIQGYLNALYEVFEQQVLTNGYEIALQVPIIVEQEMDGLNLVPGKDTLYEIKDYEAYESGYTEGLKFKQRELIGE